MHIRLIHGLAARLELIVEVVDGGRSGGVIGGGAPNSDECAPFDERTA
jgi:hypothetical protein